MLQARLLLEDEKEPQTRQRRRRRAVYRHEALPLGRIAALSVAVYLPVSHQNTNPTAARTSIVSLDRKAHLFQYLHFLQA